MNEKKVSWLFAVQEDSRAGLLNNVDNHSFSIRIHVGLASTDVANFQTANEFKMSFKSESLESNKLSILNSCLELSEKLVIIEGILFGTETERKTLKRKKHMKSYLTSELIRTGSRVFSKAR
jgi:hypothetical protein